MQYQFIQERHKSSITLRSAPRKTNPPLLHPPPGKTGKKRQANVCWHGRNAKPHTHVHLIASSIAANQQKRLSVCHRDDRSSLSAETDRRLPRGAHTRKHARRCVTAACGLFSVIGAGVNHVKTTKWQMTRGLGVGGGEGKSRKLLKDKTGSRGPQIRPDPTE